MRSHSQQSDSSTILPSFWATSEIGALLRPSQVSTQNMEVPQQDRSIVGETISTDQQIPSPGEPARAIPASEHDLAEIHPLEAPTGTAATSWWKSIFRNPHPDQRYIHASRQVQMSTANSRTNEPWGDVLLEEKPNNCTRFYGMNLNGLTIDRKGGQFDLLCRMIKEVQADVFCGQEHNLDTTQSGIRKIMYDTAAQHWNRKRLIMGTTPISFVNSYKPGGTMAITVGSLSGRVIGQVQDKWGRWVIQELQGRTQRRLVIFSVYQPVVSTPSDAAKTTVAAQHRSLLLRDEDTIAEPRRAFRRDLKAAI